MDKPVELCPRAVEELTSAVSTAASVKEHCVNAARFAIEAWDQEPESYKPMMQAYRAEFYQQDANVYAQFDAACLLLAHPDHAITADLKINGKEHTVQTTGEDAVNLAKAKMHAAAKALRADLGTGRAAGGGRTPRTTDGTKENAAAMVSFQSMLDTMLEPGNLDGFKKILNSKGYNLVRLPSAKAA